MSDIPPSGQLSRKGYDQLAMSELDREFYDRLANDKSIRRQVAEQTVAARAGGSFFVPKGQLVRIACDTDGQVADFDVFNRDNPKEFFSSSLTRVIHGAHLTTGDRLWSHPFYYRPMMTIVADSLDQSPSAEGARPHDLLYGMCDEKTHFRRTGQHGLPNCRDNLTRAAAALGLGPEAVHDPLNIFMTTGLTPESKVFYIPTRARRDDYMELYAEMNCACAISACPGNSSGPNPGGLRITFFEVQGR
jgi:uncharacterized protein YcgI (DUF1989 family)